MPGRARAREGFNIWPGFVDALTTLIIMMLFVLTVFTASQFFLSEGLVGRERRISELSQREKDLSAQVAEERARIAEAQRNIAGLRNQLDSTIAQRQALEKERSDLSERVAAAERDRAAVERERSALQLRLGELTRERLDLLARIVGLEKERSERDTRIGALEAEKRAAGEERERLTAGIADLEARLRQLEVQLRSEGQAKQQLAGEKSSLEQRLAALEARRRSEEDAGKRLAAEKLSVEQRLATLERDLEEMRRERDRLQAALVAENRAVGDQKRLTDEQAAEIALLNRQLAALRQQLSSIEAALKAAETKGEQQKVEIEDLGRRLNLALASQVQELQRYRSEFFGRLREVLGDRTDIRVVGDRFVFQSEVLFPVGSDEINPAGRDQLAKLARTLNEISAKIPTELNWVLRVDGHTDRRPIVSARFPSNWELSTARAIAVVRFLVAQGVPATRLVAAGFGEHQPLDLGEGEEAYGKNRRIELKLTER